MYERNIRYDFQSLDPDLPWLAGGGFHNFRHSTPLLPHTHPGGPEITYVSQGNVCWKLADGERMLLAGGTLAVVQPGMEHEGENRIILPCGLFWLIPDFSVPDAARNSGFTAAEMAEFAEILRRAGTRVVPAPPDYEEILRSLLRELASPSRFFRAHLRLLLCRMLSGAAAAFASPVTMARADRALAKAVGARLGAELGEKLSIGDLAAEYKLSAASLVKRFKRQTGLTPGDYRMRLKLEAARELLRKEPELSVSAVAYRFGFSSAQHFATAFRRYYGLSPKEAR